MDLNTTLLREKFVITDSPADGSEARPIAAMSNRMVVPLKNAAGKLIETFVVRAQTMHGCIRMAAKIVTTFERSGPLMARVQPFDYQDAWNSIVEDYESKFNPERWVAVYNAGMLVFSGEEHHMFLDMVEKCDSKTPGDYDAAIALAESAFATMGRKVTLRHDGNIGLVVTVKKGEGKCALILRNPNHRTNFNFMAANKGTRQIMAAQCLTVAAAFLEGIQIAFQIGMVNEKLRQKLIVRYCPEDRRSESGRRRLGRLNADIRTFENDLNVRYRPEKPDFAQIVSDAEMFTRGLFHERAEQD